MNYPLLSEDQRWQLIADAHEKFRAQCLMVSSSEYLNNSKTVQSQSTFRTRKITIKSGDSIQSIARNNNCTEQDIVDLNRLTYPFIDSSTATVTVGVAVRNQSIYIPYANASIPISKAQTETEKSEDIFYCDFLLEENKPDGKEDIVIRDNDFVFVTGIDALKQSLRTKMKRIAGLLFDNQDYGVPDIIGDISDPVSLRLFKTQLITAIKSDGRVASVKKLETTFEDNVIYVSYAVVAVGGIAASDTFQL